VKTLCSSLLAVFLVAGGLFAHEDPRGDVHPYIHVEKGNFAIYFENNTESDDIDALDRMSPLFRVVYSAQGELLAPRHRVTEVPQDNIWTPFDGMRGIATLAGSEVLFFPDYFIGKPFYMVQSKDRIERRRLPWPDDVKISDLREIVADEHTITIAAKAGSPALALYQFKRDQFEPPTIIAIGSPLTIYDFPVVSNLIFAGGKYWIAWMRGIDQFSKSEAVLSSWRPGDKTTTETILDGPGNWNSDLSLNVSGDVLCIAYHCSPKADFSTPSKIYTFFHQMK
jgi:hypothetical protein